MAINNTHIPTQHKQSNITPIHNIMQLIADKGWIPHGLSKTIMIPLIKDIKKLNDDLTNIRPISVSEFLASIFEKLMLQKIDSIVIKNKKQFGFTARRSCSNPVFILSETMKWIKKKEKKHL